MNTLYPNDFKWRKNTNFSRRRKDEGKLNIACGEHIHFDHEDQCGGRLTNSKCDTMSVDSSYSYSSNESLHVESEGGNRTKRQMKVKSNKSHVLRPVALDCEMVGVGKEKSSALARCSVVSYEGDVLYDAYVKPDKPITDYRTQWSGIRPKHMDNAISFRSARKKVKRLVKNRVLIGHALQFDLKVLKLKHYSDLIRDTSKHIPLRALAGFPRNSTPSLKRLTKQLLKWDIQVNEHCSVEDARAAMLLYRKCEKQWEKDTKGKGDQSYLADTYWPNWTESVK